MDKLENLIKSIMAECEADGEPVTREEAEEMAKMEMGAKNIKRYEQAEPKAKTSKERKVDNEKLELFNIVIKSLADVVENGNLKNEVEYSFDYNGSHYTFKLTKHRKK